jgi:hypothetical protein
MGRSDLRLELYAYGITTKKEPILSTPLVLGAVLAFAAIKAEIIHAAFISL